MKSIATLLAVVLLSTTVAFGAAEKPFEDLFHISPKTAEKLYGKQVSLRLKKAAEDFHAVLAGNKPKNAKLDMKHPVPSDGGTSFYVGDGYKLTIVMSLNGVMRGDKYFDGYMYGPEITFTKDIMGNSPNVSQVTFYPAEVLNKLLGRK